MSFVLYFLSGLAIYVSPNPSSNPSSDIWPSGERGGVGLQPCFLSALILAQ